MLMQRRKGREGRVVEEVCESGARVRLHHISVVPVHDLLFVSLCVRPRNLGTVKRSLVFLKEKPVHAVPGAADNEVITVLLPNCAYAAAWDTSQRPRDPEDAFIVCYDFCGCPSRVRS